MKNDTNNFAKRTSIQVKSILRSNTLNADVLNEGDGNHFTLYCEHSIENAYKIKKSGFIRLGKTHNGYYIKCH